MKRTILVTTLAALCVMACGCGGGPSGRNEEIARDFFEAWSEHDVEKLTSLFAEVCLYEEIATGRRYTTRSGIADYALGTITGVPDTEFSIAGIVAGEDVVAVEWIWKGTNTVGWPDMGIPATGKSFELRGASIMTIVDGRITRNSDYWDWGSFLNMITAD